ncbi:MAG: CocE/NonD family hydrolase [Gemmatimonadaceae bacterium]
MRRLAHVAFTVLCCLAATAPVTAGVGAQEPVFERRELTIPMRDGVKLFAVALVPTGVRDPLPILLIRTPFSAAGAFRSANVPAAYRELAKDGYIFVVEDIRGRFGSEGQFVTSRVQRDPRDPASTDESTDAYDTIDWLVKHLPGNNGKVGALGMSYPGWLAALASVHPHPALRAVSPQAPMTDTWLGDDFFHQGAFRQWPSVEYTTLMETDPKGFTFPSIPDYDHYTYYLKYPTLDSLAKATGIARLPSWVGFSTHPTWDAYWQARALQLVLTKPEVPTLFVGGWWDQEDILGPQLAYHVLEREDSRKWNRTVLGPWFHGAWLQPGGDSLGPLGFGRKTADEFREEILRPWFAYYLHGTGRGDFPEVWAFETGSNQWRTFDAWPPSNAQPRNLYLRANGQVSFTAPPSLPAPTQTAGGTAPEHTAAYDAYRSDPAHPIPYVPRPDDGEGWRTWLVQDQRFVDNRPDVMTWTSEPLTEDMTIAGDVVAHLFASTTGTDADWVVKLIDVYPDSVPERPALGGYELMVNADIMRGRYWKGFTKATPIPANTVTPFDVDLHEQLYRFRKGHRLMVQVQSTWFPLYDRNPQTFVPNIFQAKGSDFRAQVHRIWHTAKYPSHVTVRVLP